MDRMCRLLCVLVVVMMAVSGLTLVTSAEGQGLELTEPLQARPDLLEQIQQAEEGWESTSLASASDLEAAYQQYLSQKLVDLVSTDSRGQMAKGGGARLLAAGDKRVLVVLVDFADLAHDTIAPPGPENTVDNYVTHFDLTHYETMLFSESNVFSMRQYYQEASQYAPAPVSTGIDLLGDIQDWAVLPGNAAEYGNDLTVGVDNDATDSYDLVDFVQDSADTLAVGPFAPDGVWDDYLSGSSPTKIIDYFIIVHAGEGQEAGGGALGPDALWSTRGRLDTPYQFYSDYHVQDFVVVAEDSPVGVYVHQMAHLFGLPDTWNPVAGIDEYDDVDWYALPSDGVGEASPSFYDVMAQGMWLGQPLGTRPASMTAWERIFLGWLTPTEWRLIAPNASGPMAVSLNHLATEAALEKVVKVVLPDRPYVEPKSGDWMRQSPDPDALEEVTSTLTRTVTVSDIDPKLRFWQWYDLEPSHDYGRIFIDDGGGAVEVLPPVSGDSAGKWEQRTIDLSAYAPSATLTVEFRLERDATIDLEDGFGWFLDDLQFEEDGVVVWTDGFETDEPDWFDQFFPRKEAYVSEHYYLVEWRDDKVGFDRGLQDAYSMLDLAKGKAEFFRLNPGALIWYVNPIYQLKLGTQIWANNNVLKHPGEGMLLAVDSHPEPLWESTADAWRTRVQMQDAPFRRSDRDTYQNVLVDRDGVERTILPQPAESLFWDARGYPTYDYAYWRDPNKYNSVKTPRYGVGIEVIEELYDYQVGRVRFFADSADMSESEKLVDKSEASPGEYLNYQIVLRNTGLYDSHTICVLDPHPDHAQLIGPVTTDPLGYAQAITLDADGLRWEGIVPLNQPITISVRAQLEPVIDNGTIVTNTAYIYEGGCEFGELEAVVHAETVIESEPCLDYSEKLDYPDPVLAGDLITYTIQLSNRGTMDAMTSVLDCMPDNTVFWDGPWLTIYPVGTPLPTYNAGTDCVEWQGVVPADPYDPHKIAIEIVFVVALEPGLWEGVCSPAFAPALGGAGPQVALGGQTESGPRLAAGIRQEPTVPPTVEPPPPPFECCERVCNEAWIDDGFHAPFRLEECTTIDCVPNIWRSTKTVDKDVAKPGDVLTYTIRVYNTGNRDAEVVVDDSIPLSTTYVLGSLSATDGSFTLLPPPDFTWEGTVAPAGQVTITFQVKIDDPPFQETEVLIENCAYFSELTTLRRYVRCAEVLVTSKPVIVGEKVICDDTDAEGNCCGPKPCPEFRGTDPLNGTWVMTYTIKLTNEGTMDAPTVLVTDTIPEGAEFVPGSESASKPTVAFDPLPAPRGSVLWQGSIAVGEEVEISYAISITLTEAGTIHNIAYADDDISDPVMIELLTEVAEIQFEIPDDIACGDEVEVPVWAYNVDDMEAFQIAIAYDPSVLSCEDIIMGPHFPPWPLQVHKQCNDVAGVLTTTVVLQNQSLTGDYLLFTIKFRAVGDGCTVLTFLMADLVDGGCCTCPIPTILPDEEICAEERTIDGRVCVEGRGHEDGTLVRDGETILAVTDVDGYYEFCPPVGTDESFFVTLEASGHLTTGHHVTVEPTGQTLPYAMLLAGDIAGPSVMLLTPSSCVGDPDTWYRVLTDGDGYVDLQDLTFIANLLYKDSSDPMWGPETDCDPDYIVHRADINEDNDIDVFDLVFVGRNYWQVAPGPWPGW